VIQLNLVPLGTHTLTVGGKRVKLEVGPREGAPIKMGQAEITVVGEP
jgi:hypothetical protein